MPSPAIVSMYLYKTNIICTKNIHKYLVISATFFWPLRDFFDSCATLWWHIIRRSSHRQSLSSKLVWSQLVQDHTKKLLNQINMIASVHMVLSNKTGSRRHRVHSGGGDGGGGIRWWGAGHWGVLVVTLVVMVGGGRWRSVVGDIVCWWGIVVVRRCWSLRRWWWW